MVPLTTLSVLAFGRTIAAHHVYVQDMCQCCKRLSTAVYTAGRMDLKAPIPSDPFQPLSPPRGSQSTMFSHDYNAFGPRVAADLPHLMYRPCFTPQNHRLRTSELSESLFLPQHHTPGPRALACSPLVRHHTRMVGPLQRPCSPRLPILWTCPNPILKCENHKRS